MPATKNIPIQFNKDADLVLSKARKLSLGWTVPGPALCEELIFNAFISLKHPLYISLSGRFSLSANTLTNSLTNSIILSKKDAPVPVNQAYEKKLIELMLEEAKQRGGTAITEQDLMVTIVGHEHPKNAVCVWFKEHGINPELVIDFVRQYKSVDWIYENEFSGCDIRRTTTSAIDTSSRREADNRIEGSGRTQALSDFGKNLTELAKQGKLNRIIGRETEIAAVEVILSRMHQNNPMLIGPAGVGKTSIVEALAQRVANNQVPERLKEIQIWRIELGALIAGTSLRGQFEERIQAVIKACEADVKIVLYFPSIHLLVSNSSQGGIGDAASLIRPALTRNDIRCIGTTSVEAYYQYIERDPAMARGFEIVRISEPPVNSVIYFLTQVKDRYEAHHQVVITQEAIDAVVEFSDRYIRDRVLPNKAFTLLDQTCARFASRVDNKTITRADVALVISEKVQVPLSQVTLSRESLFEHLSDRLKQRVIGQDHVIKGIADVVQLTKYEMQINLKRPDGVFLLAGPTGTGKTELAKALAECLLGNEDKLLRFDMSEFSEKHTVAKLIGSPPGYQGSDEGGLLTNALRANPYCVVLFDEIEKAHPEIQRIFLQIFDDGRLTDSKGLTVSCEHSTIILTTNLGAPALSSKVMQTAKGPAQMEESVRQCMEPAIKQFFSPEFLNRLDKILFFSPLSNETVRRIAIQKVSKIIDRLIGRGIQVNVSDSVYDWLVSNGSSLEYGARFLNRTIEKEISLPIAETFSKGEAIKSLEITVGSDGKLIFRF